MIADENPNLAVAKVGELFGGYAASPSIPEVRSIEPEQTGERRVRVEHPGSTAQIEIGWLDWFKYFAPVGILLLAVLPLLVYWIYPPQVKEGAEVQSWATKELAKMGPRRVVKAPDWGL